MSNNEKYVSKRNLLNVVRLQGLLGGAILQIGCHASKPGLVFVVTKQKSYLSWACMTSVTFYDKRKSSRSVHSFLIKDRLTRCARGCQDKIQDKVRMNTSQSQAGKLQEEMNSCVDECCDSHCKLLTKLRERMKETLQAQKPTST